MINANKNNIDIVTYAWVKEEGLDSSISLIFTVPLDWLNQNFKIDLEEYTHDEGYNIYQKAKGNGIILNEYIDNYN